MVGLCRVVGIVSLWTRDQNHGAPIGRTPPARSRIAHGRQKSLQRTAVEFTGLQARAVGRGFAQYVERSRLEVWACAILPDHVHLVVGPSRRAVRQLVIQLKGDATEKLLKESIHPFEHLKAKSIRVPKCFARGEWKVYLDPEDVPRAIRYVELNPEKEGLRRQHWSFVSRPRW